MERTRWSYTITLAAALIVGCAMLAGCGALFPDQVSTEDSRNVATTPPMGPSESVVEPYGQSGGAAPEKGDVAAVPQPDRLVIRSKTLRLEVDRTADAVGEIRALAKKHEAIITDLRVATETDDWVYRYDESGASSGEALRGWVTVRVPAAAFEAFVDEVSALGTVKYQSEATEDVTQQHVDLAARLENLRAEEKRLREFFDAAKNVNEMLAIEQELSRVRGEIESLDAQVEYLERQAAMATVTIELTEPKPVVRPDGESWGFADAITNGFRGAAGVIKIAITALIATSPLWLTGLALLAVIRAIVRRRRASRASGESDRTPPAEPGPSATLPAEDRPEQ
jgi:hypothetical protein